jgi:membrane-bound metal-dependent hydrolase YbcI (DUF457 family)
MPSPAGHVIAGVAVAWAAEAIRPLRLRPRADGGGSAPAITPLVLACAVLALAPDFDILLASHRTFTHSLAAAAVAAVAAGAVARALGAPGLAAGLACGLAVVSHGVLDWLGRDNSTPRGLMVLWPLSAAYFYSGLDVFNDISRRYWSPHEFVFKNAVAVAREFLILGPVAAAAFWIRQRRLGNASGGPRLGETSESRIPNPESLT